MVDMTTTQLYFQVINKVTAYIYNTIIRHSLLSGHRLIIHTNIMTRHRNTLEILNNIQKAISLVKIWLTTYWILKENILRGVQIPYEGLRKDWHKDAYIYFFVLH